MAESQAATHHIKRIADAMDRLQKVAEWQALTAVTLDMPPEQVERVDRLEQVLWPERNTRA